MSTKLLHSLTDEKTDMQKQLGCMNGIFQLFDRHNFLPGRRATGHNHKRLSPGTGQDINHGTEQNGKMEKTLMQGKNSKKVGKEKLIAPVELSRTSFSSSCSSSTFSSADCNKTSQSELPSSYQSSFPETTSLVALPMKQQSSSSHLSRQSLDIRDIVKGSMYRESRGLSVKPMVKEEGGEHAIKHIDSPRPLHRHKSVQPKVRHDGSLSILAKLQDAPWNAKEQKYGSLSVAPRDTPRYSYDGRESLDKATKLKELPRLSLDSRERSSRNSASQLTSNNLSREIYSESGISSQIITLNQEPGSNKRPSTIVARLMGLEPIPDLITTDNDQMMKMKSCLDEDSDRISTSSRICDESKKKQISGSPRISCKIPASPQLRNENSVMKSTSSSRFPQEPAPWRQTESNRCSQKQEFKYQEASTNSPHASPSVYGEIKKRLTELEFKKSGKDLRALKHILEAMEKTRARPGNKKEEQILNSETRTNKCSPYNSFDRASTRQMQSNYPVSPFIKESSSPRRYGSQIVVMKPTKLHEKKPVNPPDCKPGLQKKWSGDNADNIKDLVGRRTAKDTTPRKNHLRDSSSWPQPSIEKKTNAETQRSSQHPKAASQHMGGEKPASFRRSSGTLSPRLQQKTHGTEKLSHLTTQSSGLRRAKKQSIKQPMESGSPTRKYKQKYTNLQQGDDQLSQSSSEARNLSHQGDTVSMQSDSCISLASHSDVEITSTDHTKQITGPYQLRDPNEEDFTTRFTEDGLIAELATTTLEQPSPVSVLDTTFYEEDCPSPVKKMSTAFQDYGTLNIDEAEWNAEYIDDLRSSSRLNHGSKFNQGKLKNIDKLVHKLQLMNSAQDEATKNHIESLCDNTNPDHRYIAEILVAAGILIDLGSRLTTIQLLPLGLSVNPNLFHVLEIAMGSSEPVDKYHEKGARSISSGKIRRKLVFDVVNEILVHKSALAGLGEPWIFQNKMGGRSMRGEKLLKELCSKLDHQQATTESSLDGEDDGLTSILSADMMNEPENWRDYTSELPGIVLDIERLIFKDLIDDVVSDGAAVLQGQPGRHCRKLFSK